MNIIKLKDIVMPNEYSISIFFNEKLKGKYAYWIKMRYIFPLDSLNYNAYIKYEQMTDMQMTGSNVLPHIDLYSEECCMIEFAQRYIDAAATEEANSIHIFKTSNMYSADYDIDINELKSFRSWLADELLSMNTNDEGHYMNAYTPAQTHMLEYYKNNMYNDVVKYLDMFKGSSIVPLTLITDSVSSSCSCCNNSNAINVVQPDSSCNALENYRKNIYAFMVETFSSIDFWKACNKSFLRLFKRYIDNIIKTNLTLPNVIETSYNADIYALCKCSSSNDDNFKKMMNNLSIAIQYIIDDEIAGHKNFIYDAFNRWSANAYEKMNWK